MIFQCSNCNKKCERKDRLCNRTLKYSNNLYCSKKCFYEYNNPKLVFCKNCNKEFYKQPSQIKNGRNNFCSRSCNAKYTNSNKKHGNRRSKLESYLENQLNKLFPNLQILYNNKEVIKSELDIYIPSLKLAFELNGIFHYEPIYGSDKLESIQNNDNRKFQACLEQGIELCIIDTSSQKYFKESTSEKFLNIIVNVINKVLYH